MSMQQLQLFEAKTAVKWTGITFHKDKPTIPYQQPDQAVPFCRAVAEGREKGWTLTPECIGCEGARRCFGWRKGKDEPFASNLADKTGLPVQTAYQIVQQVPQLSEDFMAISVGGNSKPDVLIAYAEPVVVMRLIRLLQTINGKNISVDLSSIMAVCGNVAVKSFLMDSIALSFGCPDSREQGGIGSNQLVIGIPYRLLQALLDLLCERSKK